MEENLRNSVGISGGGPLAAVAQARRHEAANAARP